ncbi:hypothetical protein, partial [Klebsiella pneumoniae]|uniref:hypothetical protein n=1 Tax=Klebsiella pneumoniae TaxID=573 RepID=UPI0021CE0E27
MGGSRRPDKRSAIRHKGGYGAGGSFPAALRLPGREWDSAERFAKKHLPPSNRKGGLGREPGVVFRVWPPRQSGGGVSGGVVQG